MRLDYILNLLFSGHRRIYNASGSLGHSKGITSDRKDDIIGEIEGSPEFTLTGAPNSPGGNVCKDITGSSEENIMF